MNLERVLQAASSASKNSVNLEKLFSKSVATTNQIEEQRLRARTQLLEVRQKTYTAIQQSEQDSENKDGIVEKVLGTLGLAGLSKGLKGAKSPSGVKGIGISPKPRAGVGKSIPLLSAAFTGIDFLQRKQSGQTNVQAGVGAGAGLLGALGAGAAAGAIYGSVVPGAGTLSGGIIGGTIALAASIGGGYLASSAADKLTGVDAGEQEVERRVQEEEKRTNLLITKTPFSGALDTFDAALDKLASFPGGICACAGREQPAKAPSIQRTGVDTLIEDLIPKPKAPPTPKTDPGTGTGDTTGTGKQTPIEVIPYDPNKPKTNPKPKAPPTPKTDPGTGTGDTTGTGKQTPIEVIPYDPNKPKTNPKSETSSEPTKPKPEPKKPSETPSEPTKSEPKKLSKPTPTPQSIIGETSASRYTPRTLGDPNTERPQEMVEEVIDTPEGQVSIRKPASKVEQSTPEEFFQKQELKGVKRQINPLKRIRETLSPEKNSSVGFQNNMGGQNIIALAEPNTTIVPVPVGGGTQSIGGGGGASPYQAAAKYAQMMSQITA